MVHQFYSTATGPLAPTFPRALTAQAQTAWDLVLDAIKEAAEGSEVSTQYDSMRVVSEFYPAEGKIRIHLDLEEGLSWGHGEIYDLNMKSEWIGFQRCGESELTATVIAQRIPEILQVKA